jgi:hypothetical protein
MEGTQLKLTARIAELPGLFPDENGCEPQTMQKRCTILSA